MVAKIRPIPGSELQSPLLNSAIVSITDEEKANFELYQRFIRSNVRTMRRIGMVYNMLRMIPEQSKETCSFRKKLLAWIILCEQWPFRMSWLLHILSLHQDWHKDNFLVDIYHSHMVKIIKRAESISLHKSLRGNYSELVFLDDDAHLFLSFLRVSMLSVKDVGSQPDTARRDQLRSFSQCLNPTIIPILTHITDAMRNEAVLQSLMPDVDRNANDYAVSNLSNNDGAMSYISAREYALRLAQILVLKARTPNIVGIYGEWGAGKDYMMHMTAMHVLALSISQTVDGSSLSADNKTEALTYIHQLLLNDMRCIHTLQKWLMLGGQLDQLTEDGTSISAAAVDAQWSERSQPFHLWRELMRLFLWPARYLYRTCMRPMMSILWTKRYPCHRCLQLLHTAWVQSVKLKGKCINGSNNKFFNYKTVMFNAWLYSGSDNLWAALIMALHQAVEEHYGPDFAHAEKQAHLYITALVIVIAALVLLAVIVVWQVLPDISDDAMNVLSYVGCLIAALGSVSTGTAYVWRFATMAQTRSEALANEMKTQQFKKQLGYMHSVKENLQRLGRFLEKPKKIDFWNYLLPDLFATYQTASGLLGCSKVLIRLLRRCLKGATLQDTPLLPCRLLIIVSDLDKCPPDKISEVLKALSLLTEDAPFVVLMAGDAQELARAVEIENSKYYANSGTSGFSFVDKIVDIPFALPQWSLEEKELILSQQVNPGERSVLMCEDSYDDI